MDGWIRLRETWWVYILNVMASLELIFYLLHIACIGTYFLLTSYCVHWNLFAG